MNRHFSLDKGKAVSLVFPLAEQLGWGSPEPDFLKWVDTALYADVATAADEAEWEQIPAEEREGWRLFQASLESTGTLLDLYRNSPQMFQKIAGRFSFLPCLMSWHPDADRANRELLKFSRLGQNCMYGELQKNPRHIAQQSWPVRYAYAIMATIDLTLDTYGDRLPVWAEIYGYGVKHPIPLSAYRKTMERMGWDEVKKKRELPKYRGSYRVLPAWAKSLEKLRRPFNTDHVIDYWRIGKNMILEEMPQFHLRPEWQNYHDRNYRTGAKAGAIQHAIFRDILSALRTIAGADKRKTDDAAAKGAGIQQ